MVPQQVSFVERLSLSQRVPYRRFHCNPDTNRRVKRGSTVIIQSSRRDSVLAKTLELNKSIQSLYCCCMYTKGTIRQMLCCIHNKETTLFLTNILTKVIVGERQGIPVSLSTSPADSTGSLWGYINPFPTGASQGEPATINTDSSSNT